MTGVVSGVSAVAGYLLLLASWLLLIHCVSEVAGFLLLLASLMLLVPCGWSRPCFCWFPCCLASFLLRIPCCFWCLPVFLVTSVTGVPVDESLLLLASLKLLVPWCFCPCCCWCLCNRWFPAIIGVLAVAGSLLLLASLSLLVPCCCWRPRCCWFSAVGFPYFRLRVINYCFESKLCFNFYSTNRNSELSKFWDCTAAWSSPFPHGHKHDNENSEIGVKMLFR
jgi:hypothetical protein